MNKHRLITIVISWFNIFKQSNFYDKLKRNVNVNKFIFILHTQSDLKHQIYKGVTKTQTSKTQTPDAWMYRNVRPSKNSDPLMSQRVRGGFLWSCLLKLIMTILIKYCTPVFHSELRGKALILIDFGINCSRSFYPNSKRPISVQKREPFTLVEN